MTGYVLSLARQDGRLGPQLRPSALDCAASRAARIPDPVNGEGESRCAVTPRSAASGVIGTRVRAGSHTIADLASLLQRNLVAPVQDKTGLDALFDIDLTYGWFPGMAVPQSVDNRAPDLTTALREQLGIRIEATQVLVDALIIERVEPPTEN